MSINRRSFLKSGIAGAAGISLAGPSINKVLGKTTQGLAWTDKMPINPNIDNMRVICMHDEDMAGTFSREDFQSMDAAVDEQKVRDNMDGMARYLTEKTDTDEAWRTIFRSGKEWADTKVMIKLNCVADNMFARSAVVKKITDVLIGFGVKPANIVHFDGQGAFLNKYASIVSLTDETKIRGVASSSYDDMGGRANVTIPGINGGYGPADLVNGVTDIIVNIAVNKGHDSNFNVGKTTLCLKNHFGTFLENNGWAMHLHSTTGLINCNKVAEIVGGDPVRQQLCIIDTLWAINRNVTGGVTDKPDRLIMGTFAGAVDYCCVKKIREEIMGVTNHEANVIPKFLTEFGYSEEDPEWIEITPDMVKVGKVNPVRGSSNLFFTAEHPSFRRTELKLSLVNGRGPVTAQVFDIKGACIRTIHQSGNSSRINWDGKTAGGRRVSGGTYLVKVRAGNATAAGRISLL
jgi:hypothetical protein